MNVSGSRDHQRCLFETLYKLPQLDWLGHDVPEDSHLTVLEYPKLLSRLREASFHWKWNSHLLSTTGGIEGLGIGFDGSNVQADGGNAMWIMLRKIPNLKKGHNEVGSYLEPGRRSLSASHQGPEDRNS